MFCTVGLTCVDIVSFVPKYPAEDSDQSRCTRQSWERGGNASNNTSVLAVLGAEVEYLGTLANDHLLSFLKTDMQSYGFNFSNCPIIDNHKCPLSVVINCEDSGSRTIIHNSTTLPELSLDNFKNSLNLNEYSWIHFEGRNENVTIEFLKIIKKFNELNPKPDAESFPKTNNVPNYKLKRLPVSVEIETTRDSLFELIPLGDVVFVGKDFCNWKGVNNCFDAVEMCSKPARKGTLIVCPWGDKGAAYCIAGLNPLEIKKVDAVANHKIVDSLGAGDTFIASVLFGLKGGLNIESSVRFGCKVASAKLSQFGFRNIGNAAKKMQEYHEITELAEIK